ncbi:MAG: family 1 glycosylhydrolase [Thermodesulfovibrionales bacterium]|nr:family 1 glycosylhydrolase [Thermodesulfovibrionales bacterium]
MGFLWGVATSAFQLEGSPYADWTSWDDVLCASPDITNHYYCYKDDLKLLNELGVNAYRFSVEWSRIQPRENRWDISALQHYSDIVSILIDNGITPMVTIHHFTHPLWFIKKYPWHEDSSIEKFMLFVERVVKTLSKVRYWITFNEPYVLLLGGYIEGCMPPGIRDVKTSVKALQNILICHSMAYDLIHSHVKDAEVSIAHNMASFAPWHRYNPFDRILSKIAKRFYNHSIIDAFMTGVLKVKFPFYEEFIKELPIKGKLDFFGLNYYTRLHLRFNPFRRMFIEIRHRDLDGFGLTDLGWEIHPKGLEKVIKTASRLNVPIIITENGIATKNSHKKIVYMKRHIDVVEQCIKKGYDIRGYFYWSLIDNYEWLQGLDARFGLYKVDFKTFKRQPTTAAKYYSYLISSRRMG